MVFCYFSKLTEPSCPISIGRHFQQPESLPYFVKIGSTHIFFCFSRWYPSSFQLVYNLHENYRYNPHKHHLAPFSSTTIVYGWYSLYGLIWFIKQIVTGKAPPCTIDFSCFNPFFQIKETISRQVAMVWPPHWSRSEWYLSRWNHLQLLVPPRGDVSWFIAPSTCCYNYQKP